MNILLLRPGNDRRSYFSRFNLSEPLTEIYLAPVLAGDTGDGSPRHVVRALDLRVLPDLAAELRDFTPDVAVVSVHPHSLGGLDLLLGRLKQRFPRLRVLLVGAAEYGSEHVVERPQDFLRPLADALVPGFFLQPVQRTVSQVIAAWDAGRGGSAGDELRSVAGLWVQSSPGHWEATAPLAHTVGDIGVPDRTVLGRARGRYSLGGIGRLAYVTFSYGCRFACRYCSMSKTGGALVTRPIPDVLDELAALSEPNVFLSDFEPLQAPEAMLALADSIAAQGLRKHWYLLTRADSALDQAQVLRRWKEIGLRWVFLGIDGHSEARLRQIGKGSTMAVSEAAIESVRRLGLGPAVGITVPVDATRADFTALAETARRLRAPLVDFTVETPLIGTRYFDQSGGLATTRDWSLYDMHHAVLPTRLPLEEFYREMTKLHLLAGRLSVPGMLRHYPLRDVLRNVGRGPAALWHVGRAARDHAAA